MIQKNDIKNIPSETGVYLFRRRRTPLYIGKSINLKARLASHLADSKISAKEARIVRESDNVVYKTTLSDFDAILLESKLIKKYRPKYNVILKDDKHYIYIKITVKDRYPKVFAVRKENDNKSLYFGPFYSARVTRGLIREIRRVIPLCTTTRVTSRPCFYSKIGLCNPCPNVIEHHPDSKIKKLLYKKYKKNIRSVISLLSGKSIRLFTRLKRSIQKEVKKEHYEEALIIRDKLYSFDKLLSRQQFGSGYEALHLPDPSLLHKQLSKLLKDQFGVKRLPRRFRIECYDISNIFGDYAAGSMVVFSTSHFEKKSYKRFRIKTVKRISDVHMMQEVLSRRFRNSAWPRPHLILVDGGRPQVLAVQRTLNSINLTTPLIGIAKHPDRIVTLKKTVSPFVIDKTSELFKTFVAIRDESHRFAKAYHILLRKKHILI